MFVFVYAAAGRAGLARRRFDLDHLPGFVGQVLCQAPPAEGRPALQVQVLQRDELAQ